MLRAPPRTSAPGSAMAAAGGGRSFEGDQNSSELRRVVHDGRPRGNAGPMTGPQPAAANGRNSNRFSRAGIVRAFRTTAKGTTRGDRGPQSLQPNMAFAHTQPLTRQGT